MCPVYAGHEVPINNSGNLGNSSGKAPSFYICSQQSNIGRKPMRCRGITKVLLTILIAICTAVTTARGAELLPLRATHASIGRSSAPLWIAQDKGVFNKYGLAVDLRYMLSATGTQALLSGSMDIVN